MSALECKSDQGQNTGLVFCVLHASKNIYILLEENIWQWNLRDDRVQISMPTEKLKG